jgi:cyclophilin family peptidyl-prolyl cis-trans isomerase
VPTDKRQRQREGRQARQAELRRAQQRKQQRRRYAIIGVVVLVLFGVFYFATRGSSKKKTNVSANGSSTTAAPGASTTAAAAGGPPKAQPVPAGAKLTTWTCPKADGSSPRTDQFPNTAPPMCIDPAKTYTAHLTTSEGAVDFTLDTKKTPNTANNYVVLALYHYYDGSSIDRIDTSIDILQTGSPKTQNISDPGPGYTIKDEGTGFKYQDGDVVMARSSTPDSGSAQYFFVVGPKASSLNSQGTYVTFGHVTTGLDVLHKIESLYVACNPSDQSCLGGGPSRVVTISKVTITEA